MSRVIVVSDVIDQGDNVVIAGINNSYDRLSRAQIRSRIGQSVRVSGKTYRVIGVEAAESLIGKKNIFIKLAKDGTEPSRFRGKTVETA